MDVKIRKITKEDTENIILWRNSPSVVKNFIYRTPLTKETHLNWLKNRVETGEAAQFIIYDISSSEDIGSVYLRDIDKVNKKAEFGIFIGQESARGKGFGTKATKLILQYGLEDLNLNKIFLRVFSENVQAIKSYEAAGFVKEGIFRKDVIIENKPVDMVFMAILKEDWGN